MLSKAELLSIKRKALRKKVWFKVLSQAERALIDLTIQVVDVVRSNRLARVLLDPIEKLKEAMKGMMDRAREIGWPLAEKFSKIALAWGHPEARSWAEDEFYATYLGLGVLNKPIGLYP